MTNCRISSGSTMASLLCITIFTSLLLVQVESKSQDDCVRAHLSNFNSTRNNHVSPAAKTAARDYIIQTFKGHGLDTWTEQFASNQIEFPGINVIGRVSGRYTGTSQDKVVIIASHYDSVQTTNGVDDNGSGMTALLQAVKQYMSPDNLKCTQDFTLLFVAFDLEEVQPCTNRSAGFCACERSLCGSDSFVNNFSRYLNDTGGAIQGAFVMDTIMNYNTTPHSQYVPQQLLASMGGMSKELIADQFRGRFLTVIGRKKDDADLTAKFMKSYPKTVAYTAKNVSLPFSGRPADQGQLVQNMIGNFLRSDHRRFWNHQKSWPAVFLTDTANFRGHMRTCYHEMCDDMSHVTPEMITFMGKTTDALVGAAKEMSKRECTNKVKDCSGIETSSKNTFTTLYHPSVYPNGADCIWTRETGSEQSITFEEWELEDSVNCTNDYLEIRDGREPTDPVIGRFCGKTKPNVLKLKPKNKHIHLRFRSDAFEVYKGFKITLSGTGPAISGSSFVALAVALMLCLLMTSHQ